MKGSIELLGRGLLVLALSGYVVGCGDDDGGGKDPDSGAGGEGGTTAGGGSGGGGTGGSEPDAGGGDVSMAECVEMTNDATMDMVMPACATCVCENGLTQAVTCAQSPMCWPLISCVGSMCPGLTGTARMTCAGTMCGSFLAGVAPATALGTVITTDCVDECVAAPPGEDAGADAGN